MELKALKQKIKDKTLNDDLIIFKYADNKFLCKQYIDTIAELRNKEKVYVHSIYEADEDSFGVDDSLYIIDVDELKEYPDASFKNLIIMCKKLPDNLEVDYIDVAKPVNWQIEDFVKYRLKGLDDNTILWLCQICGYDIYRLDQECKKIESFPVGSQKEIFRQINADNGYCDLTDLNIFNFTDALILHDMQKVISMMKEMELIDIEPLAVVTILLKKFKQLLAVKTNNQSYIKELKMSDKQVWYLRSNQASKFSEGKLINNIEFLTGIDYKIKSGNLDLSRDNLLSYITCNLI